MQFVTDIGAGDIPIPDQIMVTRNALRLGFNERDHRSTGARGADTIQRLKPNAVGLVGVLFMAVATAAPITAMVGNVPISVASVTARTRGRLFRRHHRADLFAIATPR